MKKTALTEVHREMGAKMVPFAGYEMPVQYSKGLRAEHEAVRNAVGIFDVSHMGEFILEGEKALDLLQWISSNDASKLEPGKAQYSCMPNGQGGIVDDLIIYMLEENKYMLVVNAANIDKDWEWISSQNKMNAQMRNISDDIALLAIQGPKATETLQGLTEVDLNAIKFYRFTTGRIAGIDDVIISATGYTGSGGFELYLPANKAKEAWNKILEAGEPHGIEPAGLGARDTLRLEMGLCLYGNDIDDTTSPIEAKLGWITKFTKDFVDADRLKKQKEEGIEQKLIGFELKDRGVPRKDYDLVDDQGKKIGRVTSGTMAPSLNKPIGMGYVQIDHAAPGNTIFVDIRGKMREAEVVKTPFYRP